jgi:hypothetical protein
MPYKKANYIHKRQQPPSKFKSETFRTVPISHARTPTGQEFKRKFPKGTKAIVGQVKKPTKNQRKSQTQSILIPKRK